MIDLNTTKISVIVPVYNSSRTLRKCLEALQQQSDDNYELIVVDDASYDDSRVICNDFDARILTLPVNKGQAVARNEGVKAASGEIIAFVDSDAVTPSDWLKKYRKLLAEYKDADVICSGYSGEMIKKTPARFAYYETVYRRQNIPVYISSTTSSNCIIYKKAFLKVGGYPEYYINTRNGTKNQKAVAINEDAELGFLLKKNGRKIVWSHDNPVMHFFRDSWKGYLKQQSGFSRAAVLTVFKFPDIFLNGDIYNKNAVILEATVIFFMALSIALIFWGKMMAILVFFIIEIAGLLSLYLINRYFFKFLKMNMEGYSFLPLFFWTIVSRIYWIFGMILGFKDGCFMIANNCLHKLGSK